MPKTHLKPMNTLFILLIFLHTHFKICNGVSASGFNSLKTASELDEMMRRVCGGGECIEEIDSESNRRVLVMQRRFISYETLKRDLVPCTKPGASYYNCRAAGAANPYNRGCEVITGCARDISDIKSWWKCGTGSDIYVDGSGKNFLLFSCVENPFWGFKFMFVYSRLVVHLVMYEWMDFSFDFSCDN